MHKVLFVCLGNICRSPMAEFVMKDMVKKAGREDEFEIASVAVSRDEVGNPVYPPARQELAKHGISCDGHAARQITERDLEHFDHIYYMDASNARYLRRLQDMMLHFQAFGTVATANVSRWHNIKQIYHHLITVNDIPDAVEDVSTKLSILSARQDALEQQRSARVSNIITVFGLVSILDSALSIAQSLQSGNPLLYECTKLTAVLLVILLLSAMLRRK